MINYRSKQLPKIYESIVYSFDLNTNCKYISFGLSSSRDKKTIDQNIFVFKNIPYWYNSISEDLSCFIENDKVSLSNCGEKLLNKSFFILDPSINSTISNLSDKSEFQYQFYIESDDASPTDITIFYNNKTYKLVENKDNSILSLKPIVSQSKIYINDIQLSKEDDYWLLLDNETLLTLDYEFEFKSSDENYSASTIMPMVNDKIENFYYTNKIPSKDCRMRFIIDDKGRYISLSCADSISSNDYNESDSFIFSNNFVLGELEKSKKDKVSVRFSIEEIDEDGNSSENKNYCTNLSSNF